MKSRSRSYCDRTRSSRSRAETRTFPRLSRGSSTVLWRTGGRTDTRRPAISAPRCAKSCERVQTSTTAALRDRMPEDSDETLTVAGNLLAAGSSDVGNVRAENEDAFAVLPGDNLFI